MIPKKYSDLIAAARKFGEPELIIVERLHRAVDSLGVNDLAELQGVCREILERCDADELYARIGELLARKHTGESKGSGVFVVPSKIPDPFDSPILKARGPSITTSHQATIS